MGKKKGFIIYNDWCDIFEPLNFEERGRLISSIFDYVNKDIEPDFEDSGLRISFNVIRNALKRDEVKYEKKCLINAENARKRWEMKHNSGNRDGKKDNESKQSDAMEGEGIRTDANCADIDKDTDKDKDKDTNTDRDRGTDIERDKNRDIIINKHSPSFSKKTACVYSEDFLTFWKEYPKKTGKGEAFKQWNKQGIGEEELKDILNALKWQKNASQWQKSGGRFIPYPSTYISQRRWEDEPDRDLKGDITDPHRYTEGDILPDYIMRGEY